MPSLSILIPIYNYNVVPLVTELNRQCISAAINYEIICIDDNSTKFIEGNGRLADIPGVRLIRLKNNIGRSAIRNKLADEARNEYLIFIDCDAGIENCPDFIKNYIENAEPMTLVFGGWLYHRTLASPDKSLRYYYGIKVEETTAMQRAKRPYEMFTTFNFMIDGRVFGKVRFNEDLIMSEDTLFIQDIQRAGIKVKHIDNQLYHLGIDDNETYLHKAERCIKTAFQYRDIMQTRVVDTYNRLEKFHLLGLYRLFFSVFGSAIKKNLLSRKPSMFLFNLYKLGYVCELARKRPV